MTYELGNNPEDPIGDALDEAERMCARLAAALRLAASYLEVTADDPFNIDSHGAKADLEKVRLVLAAYEEFKG